MKNTTTDDAEFMTTEEVAQRLRVTRASVTAWVRQGKLKAVRFGRRWLISRKEADAMLGVGEE